MHPTPSPPASASKIKVLHIISGDLWAGAEAMALTLLRRLQKNEGLELCVLLLNHGRLADSLKSCCLRVHVIDEQTHSFRQIQAKTRKIVAQWAPDIIHSHRYKENILALLARGLNRRIRLIATQHGLPEHYGTRVSLSARFMARMHQSMLARFFSTVIAVSTDVRSFLLKRCGLPKERVEIIHNGIELPDVSAGRDGNGQCFVVGSSGRLVKVKDYQLFCEILHYLPARTKVRFELAGEGPQRPLLETLVRRYDMEEDFVLRGHQEDMDSFYQGLDLYVNTSIHEGIPMTVLEALARGLPVIAPAVGGLTEIINDGVEGFLIPDREPQSFAAKCLLLMENEALREEMSQAARKRAQSAFSDHAMADAYYRLYCRTLNT